MPQQAQRRKSRGAGRAFRGLILVFLFSFLNLVGVILTATALGGFAPWTSLQFVGVFGVLEAASGLANVISPNVWRLPVAELATSARTDVKLAASALLLPHWGGLARFAAGVACIGAAAWEGGLAPASIALVPFVVALGWSILAISALLARAGVARPDLDVLQLVVRWGRREREMPAISLSGARFQFALSIVTLPAVKLLSPSVLSSRRSRHPRSRSSSYSPCPPSSGRSSTSSGRTASSGTRRESSSARPRRTPDELVEPHGAAAPCICSVTVSRRRFSLPFRNSAM